jgi:hypothetical protein
MSFINLANRGEFPAVGHANSRDFLSKLTSRNGVSLPAHGYGLTQPGDSAKLESLIEEGQRLNAKRWTQRRETNYSRSAVAMLATVNAKRRAMLSQEAAYHEAAHAAFIVLNGIAGLVSASIDGNNGGVVLCFAKTAPELALPSAFVGYAAEARLNGTPDDWRVLGTDADDAALALAKVPSQSRAQATAEAREKATDFCKRRWKPIAALADELIQRGRIGRDDCEQIIRANI